MGSSAFKHDHSVSGIVARQRDISMNIPCNACGRGSRVVGSGNSCTRPRTDNDISGHCVCEGPGSRANAPQRGRRDRQIAIDSRTRRE